MKPMPEWRWVVLYHWKKCRQWARASSMLPNRSGKSGRYLSVLNWASEYGLSSETCGRLWVLATSRSTSKAATGLRRFAGAAIGMQRQRAGGDVMLGHGLGDQRFGQLRGLPQGDHPADHIAAEDVEDHVQVIATPLDRALEFRDIPTPHFIGPHRQQFRLGVGRMDDLVAPLTRLPKRCQQAVHGAHRAEVAPLIEQRGIDARWGAVG